MNYLEEKKMALMNSIAKGGRLPSQYQEVNYIHFPFGSYINLGVTTTQIDRLETDFIPDSVSHTAQHILGARTDMSNYKLFLQIGNYAPLNLAIYLTTPIGGNSPTLWSTTEKNSIDVILRSGYQRVYVNDVLRGNNAIVGTPQSANLYLGAWNANGNITADINVKMYETKLSWWNGTDYDLVQDLVPCYRKSDNEVGMYDLVTNTFFANSGTGSFSYGTEV